MRNNYKFTSLVISGLSVVLSVAVLLVVLGGVILEAVGEAVGVDKIEEPGVCDNASIN